MYSIHYTENKEDSAVYNQRIIIVVYHMLIMKYDTHADLFPTSVLCTFIASFHDPRPAARNHSKSVFDNKFRNLYCFFIIFRPRSQPGRSINRSTGADL